MTVVQDIAVGQIGTAASSALGALRVMTCGSVDDGKSTLIGRILFDARLLLDDQLAQLKVDSKRHGSAGDEIDYSLLMDGLAAEREQAITIDVAYRFATTPKRRLIFADAPGHEQYTRNMATAASTADAALLLVDARNGVVTQTRRHAFIASLMGVEHILLVVNKMDLVDFDEAVFQGIVASFVETVPTTGFRSVTHIPVSARRGDNVIAASAAMPWFKGDPVLACLEKLERGGDKADQPFRLPAQWVNRPNASFRGYAGTIAAGRVRVGDEVTVAGTHVAAKVSEILASEGSADQASAEDAVTIRLDREVDISRGDIVCAAGQPAEVADQFSAHMVWLSPSPLIPGRSYLFKAGARTIDGSITSLRHRIDVNTREERAASKLEMNDVGRVNVSLASAIAFAPYAENRHLGGFIVIDRQTNATVGVGMIEHALKRSSNIAWQNLIVGREQRAAAKGQLPAVLWFTGLSGSGKSTIANLVEARLHALGRHSYMLDGDNVRHGLNRDLGFTEADRVENIRRVSEVAALFADAGLIVLVSFISPYRAERDAARARLPAGEFLEVFVDTSLDECKRRDPKGLYVKAMSGAIPNFTGISAPYEAPLAPDIHLDTAAAPAERLAEAVVEVLRARGVID